MNNYGGKRAEGLFFCIYIVNRGAESSLGIISNCLSAYTKITRHHSRKAGDFLFTCIIKASQNFNLTQTLFMYCDFLCLGCFYQSDLFMFYMPQVARCKPRRIL